MKRMDHKNPTGRDAMTLVELLAVMAIIGVLIGLSIGGIKYFSRSSSETATSALILELERAIEAYRLDTGKLPEIDATIVTDIRDLRTSLSSMRTPAVVDTAAASTKLLLQNILITPTNNAKKPYMLFQENQLGTTSGGDPYIRDAFGYPIIYDPASTAKTNTGGVYFAGSFDLMSFGFDLQSGTDDTKEDDITNYP